jgi:alkylation response protein AidB-like acyl-CoA dehydrogenase
MYVRVMLARGAAYAAAAILDDPEAGDLDAAAGSAKVVAGEAAMANARTCIQVHGGMGFTWEMMPHYLLKRTWVLEHTFGTSAEHAEALAAGIGSRP